jgi:hypothetical protein
MQNSDGTKLASSLLKRTKAARTRAALSVQASLQPRT